MNARAQILVGADEFVNAFRADAAAATQSVFVQVLTFEADSAGLDFADLLLGSPAKDVRLLVDSYIKTMISDRFLYSPRALMDRRLQQEAWATYLLIESLDESGVQTRYTNPMGFLMRRMARRNHKKLYLIDDRVSYVGGINISDHNFRWHDMMLRIEDHQIATFLREDFLLSWSGERRWGRFDFGPLSIYLFDGRHNEMLFDDLFRLLGRARRTIWLQTPYATFPLFEHLRAATERGVDVDFIVPQNNNKPLFGCYTNWETRRAGIRLRYLPGEMSHLKAMLIDDSTLVVGSSNFDYLSYRVEEELLVVVRDRAIIESFKDRVVKPDRIASSSYPADTHSLAGISAYFGLRAVLGLSTALSH